MKFRIILAMALATVGTLAVLSTALAGDISWGALKCKYNPKCSDQPKPQQVPVNEDNKNQG